MTEEDTLVLEIIRQDDSLAMSLLERKELVSTLRHYSRMPYSAQETDLLCQEVGFLLGKAAKAGQHDHDRVGQLKKSCQVLWDHLLTRPVKERLRAGPVKDLVIFLDEELVHIPWELLFDGGNFLCLNFNVGRLIRTREQPEHLRYRDFSPRLKMLVLANPTNDLGEAYQEGLNIKNQFDRKRDSVLIDFKSTQIDRLYVKKTLGEYEIVHFAGHCEYDEDNPANTGWVLHDGRLTARDIQSMGHSVSMPALIFSNACYSAKTSPLNYSYHEKNYNLASAFLFSGVRHYIGAVRRIEDPLSQEFAKEFYSQLIAGKSVGECMRLGRLKLIKEHGIAAISWASYLLYGDPNFVLFASAAPPGRAASKKASRVSKKALAWITAVTLGAIALTLLKSWLPTIDPRTYILFQRARGLFTEGNNAAVISISCGLAESDPLFLSTYPQLGQTYLRLGLWEKALKSYFDYALASEKRNDTKSLAEAYIGIGWVYHLQGVYEKAGEFYNKALKISKENKALLNEAVALRKLAVLCMDRSEYDRALELLTKSSEINRERQSVYAHKYNLACDYFDLGLVFTDKEDFSAARVFYGKSRELFEKLHLKSELSDYYFNLGEIYQFEKEYHSAIECYLKGLKIDSDQSNLISLPGDYNMLGELYLEMNKASEAKDCFRRAISLAGQVGLKEDVAIAQKNLEKLSNKELAASP